MFTISLYRKNRDKFANWYIHQKPSTRQIITAAFLTFYEDKGVTPNIPPLSSKREVAKFIFDDLQSWSVERFNYYPLSEEVTLSFHPFVYFKGDRSDFLVRSKVQDSYEND